MAASVLTVLYRAGLTCKSRELSLGLLVVPVLVRLLDEDASAKSNSKSVKDDSDIRSINQTIKEQAPIVLASLVTDSIELQKAAVDAQVIKKLSQMLKQTFDALPETIGSAWTPNPSPTSPTGASNISVKPSPLLLHNLRVREGTCRALAALALFKDEYRSAIINTSVIGFIVDCLHPRILRTKTEKDKPAVVKPEDGDNPSSVLVAACGAIRALSRSVSLLRTNLIDAGVAQPVFELLKHVDVDVKVAATAAVCNLVLDFSPMREVSLEKFVHTTLNANIFSRVLFKQVL
jgi:hypothetical protein